MSYNKRDMSKDLRLSSKKRTTSNGFQLDKFMFNNEMGKNWFSNKVVDE